jgi:DNA-binding CsgD family transcriptional regulator
VPWAICYRATLALGRGRPAEALAIIDPFAEQMTEGLPALRSWALAVRGAARLVAGDEKAADADLRLAREAATSVNEQWVVALAADGLGVLARRRGDTGRAEDLHHEALAIRITRRFRPGVVGSLEALAFIAADQESYDEAVRLFGAAAALHDAIGLVRWPASQVDWEDTVARLRAALGDAAFEVAWAEGRALSIDDAFGYASRARGERKRPSTGWGSLTPTEQRVVALVAEGLTNPQIAARLFVSRGTVKVHLSHVFAKLELSTRADLAAQATRRAIEVSGT